MRQSKDYGGPLGRSFDDKSLWQYQGISAIRLECSKDRMFSIQMKYGDTWTTKHGGNGRIGGCYHSCNAYTRTLAEDERITRVKMRIAPHGWGENFISGATFYTDRGELITCGKMSPGPGVTIAVSQGHQLQFISGKWGAVVNKLRFHWGKKQARMRLDRVTPSQIPFTGSEIALCC